jgi:hypothetical protein
MILFAFADRSIKDIPPRFLHTKSRNIFIARHMADAMLTVGICCLINNHISYPKYFLYLKLVLGLVECEL